MIDHIVNAFTLNSSLSLNAGNHTYIGHGGLLNGDAFPGDGNDVLNGGAGRDYMTGGPERMCLFLPIPASPA